MSDPVREALVRIVDKRTLVSDDPADGFTVSLREMRYAEAALAAPQPALDAPVPTDSLDAAWAEAEAALPLQGWRAETGAWVMPTGGWRIEIQYLPPEGDGFYEPHLSEAYVAHATVSAIKPFHAYGLASPTPTAALQALTAKLREREA